MGDDHRSYSNDRDIDQVIATLKKGAYLLKYGRRGKPKFSPFQISNDETTLIWYSGKKEKRLKLDRVSTIIRGQRTAIFQRYPLPEKEHQSFSLIYGDRSLDLICKDKKEAEIWFAGLKALTSRGLHVVNRNSRSSDAQSRLGKAISDVILYSKSLNALESSPIADGLVRVSLSSAVSSSSQSSFPDDFDAVGDVYIWGQRVGVSSLSASDTNLPKLLNSSNFLDARAIACGASHCALVNRQGDVFSWGEESGGRLGHGLDADVSHPKLVDSLSGMTVEAISCGEYHTCAVTGNGELFTWGSVNEVQRWLPRRVGGEFRSVRVSEVSCGAFHTAVVSISGQLFTFGDGAFGVLGHGDYSSNVIPREIDALRGLRTVNVACGVWHTAAVVEIECSGDEDRDSGKVFTWGQGDNGRLGHGDLETRNFPTMVASLRDKSVSQVSCGDNMTAALTTGGKVFSTDIAGKTHHVGGKLSDHFVEQIACGSSHYAALTSKGEVFTWGKGTNGQLGHGDYKTRNSPTTVSYLKDKHVKSVTCGRNFTAAICVRKWMPCPDRNSCTGCRNPFTFRRKRHNCYNCGLVFCHVCSPRKSLRAALAPNASKAYRVCDECFFKLKKLADPYRILKAKQIVSTLEKGSVPEAKKSDRVFPTISGDLRVAVSDTLNGGSTQHRGGDSNRVSVGYRDEVSKLRLRVEELSSRYHVLESELETRTRLLNEAKSEAVNASEKCESANVIRTLTTQVKELERSGSDLDPNDSPSVLATESNQRLVQAEVGVYLTLVPLADGVNELKRVRFSRKYFKEQDAEKWWAENGAVMIDKYNIRTTL